MNNISIKQSLNFAVSFFKNNWQILVGVSFLMGFLPYMGGILTGTMSSNPLAIQDPTILDPQTVLISTAINLVMAVVLAFIVVILNKNVLDGLRSESAKIHFKLPDNLSKIFLAFVRYFFLIVGMLFLLMVGFGIITLVSVSTGVAVLTPIFTIILIIVVIFFSITQTFVGFYIIENPTKKAFSVLKENYNLYKNNKNVYLKYFLFVILIALIFGGILIGLALPSLTSGNMQTESFDSMNIIYLLVFALLQLVFVPILLVTRACIYNELTKNISSAENQATQPEPTLS